MEVSTARIVPSFPMGEAILSARSAGDAATHVGGLFDPRFGFDTERPMPIAARSVWDPIGLCFDRAKAAISD